MNYLKKKNVIIFGEVIVGDIWRNLEWENREKIFHFVISLYETIKLKKNSIKINAFSEK